ncbi:peptidylprolyl isomerase [Fimbriimonas ginsengisoli]|nr:peptidyl-prolyl cis-trans isomerase [Fimbriimonas ginsengisoli]
MFIAALAVLAATAAFAQVDPARTVVIVNGEEIKGGEYYHRMEFLPGVGKKTGATISEFPPGFLTIEQLITERLVFQLAKKKGVSPTDMEVDAEYRNRKEETPNLDELWIGTGRSLDDLRYQIRYELAQFKIQTFGVTVTDQEVASYFNAHPDEFTIPKKYQLRVIVVKADADKSAVDSALSGGTSFADTAKKYSTDLTKGIGGEYGQVPETMLGASVRNAIAATKIGGTTDWIPTQLQGGETAYVKFLVENIIAAKKLSLDDKLKVRVRKKLMMDRGNVKNNIDKEMKAMRLDAKIDIKEPNFADAYRKFIDAYLKQGG